MVAIVYYTYLNEHGANAESVDQGRSTRGSLTKIRGQWAAFCQIFEISVAVEIEKLLYLSLRLGNYWQGILVHMPVDFRDLNLQGLPLRG